MTELSSGIDVCEFDESIASPADMNAVVIRAGRRLAIFGLSVEFARQTNLFQIVFWCNTSNSTTYLAVCSLGWKVAEVKRFGSKVLFWRSRGWSALFGDSCRARGSCNDGLFIQED